MQVPRRQQARDVPLEAGWVGLLTRDWTPLAMCTSSCKTTRLVHTRHTRARKIQDKTASSACWSLDLQLCGTASAGCSCF